uniref:Uncharacterized protein n=1 Tax=Mycobacterium kansasii TaxID=1768 RepID=A0A653EQV6_MYCKA|nr:hypothetical protein BIN_B_02169 [Mycobacterium kansasii]
MAADVLPPGKWTAALIGSWWSTPSTELHAGAQHWGASMTQRRELAQSLRNQRNVLSQNQGKTAENPIARYSEGERSRLDIAENIEVKSKVFSSRVDAMDYPGGAQRRAGQGPLVGPAQWSGEIWRSQTARGY